MQQVHEHDDSTILTANSSSARMSSSFRVGNQRRRAFPAGARNNGVSVIRIPHTMLPTTMSNEPDLRPTHASRVDNAVSTSSTASPTLYGEQTIHYIGMLASGFNNHVKIHLKIWCQCQKIRFKCYQGFVLAIGFVLFIFKKMIKTCK